MTPDEELENESFSGSQAWMLKWIEAERRVEAIPTAFRSAFILKLDAVERDRLREEARRAALAHRTGICHRTPGTCVGAISPTLPEQPSGPTPPAPSEKA